MRVLAFYLPQFHPIPENDQWWGTGFTEWRNVVKGRPLFRGHYQPHLPADLGFYDLRVPEVREKQAEYARSHAISGFCYYHYWFDGRRLLQRPFEDVLASGRPDFPFCLCWANENWTRRWDGREQEVLIAQRYSLDDDRAHIRHVLPAFRDDRYIKVDGKPVFLVYRTELLPEPARTAELWRTEARAGGFDDLYLVRVERFGAGVDPRYIGFDATAEFAPDGRVLPSPAFRRARWDLRARIYLRLRRLGLLSEAYFEHSVYSYDSLVDGMLRKPPVSYTCFRCVTPGWDNAVRRSEGAVIFHESTPERYGEWLTRALEETLRERRGDERIVFVNAWNEWGEGNHLEPDERWGTAYLSATRDAVRRSVAGAANSPASKPAGGRPVGPFQPRESDRGAGAPDDVLRQSEA